MAEGTPEQRDYLQDLQLKSNQVADSTLDSTRRMMGYCEESENYGAKTLAMLHDQGEQLNRIEENMDQINEDMVEAERNLKGMEKCCGLCVLPCKKKPEFKENSSLWKSDKDSGVVTSQPGRPVANNATSNTASGPYISRITNDAREDEMEENMQQVGSMLSNMRNMAIDMGNEIEGQNRQLDRINNKAESNEDRVKSAHKRAEAILKKA